MTHDRSLLRRFLQEHVERNRLGIAAYLPRLQQSPFFLVAATGLGKTVAVPLHLLIETRWSSEGPGRIYVVEPTVPICREEARHLNQVFRAAQPRSPLPFGALTGAGSDNTRAPVLFVTTGILEQIVRDDVDPQRVRIVIDEAHRVLGSSAGAELAVAIARRRGVTVDFMSATVDTEGLAGVLGVEVLRADAQRYPILKAPSGGPIDGCVERVIAACLFDGGRGVLPEAASFPQASVRDEAGRVLRHLREPGSFVDPVDGVRYQGTTERAQGALVVVTSHSGARSDTRRLGALLEASLGRRGVVVLPFASEIARDEVRRGAFEERLRRVEAERGRYVIVATNVIEMGVTFPSLDYVVTVDTELTEEDGRLRTVPLGINSFFQRIGRVGRKRPGAAVVTSEEGGAAWSRWPAARLASDLRYEPIRFASRGDLRPLALETFVQGAKDTQLPGLLRHLALPSRPEEDARVLQSLVQERASLRAAGLATADRLTAEGERYRSVGVVAGLAHGALLGRVTRGPGPVAIAAAVAGAAEAVPLSELVSRAAEPSRGSLDEVEVVPEVWLARPIREVHAALCRLDGSDADALQAAGIRPEALASVGVALTRGLRPAPLPAGRPTSFELRRSAILLDPECELLSVYAIVRYFQARFEPAPAGEEAFETAARRTALEDECRVLGVAPGKLRLIQRRLRDVLRKASLRLPRGAAPGRALPPSVVAAAQATGLPPVHLERAWRDEQDAPVEFLPLLSATERGLFIDAVRAISAFRSVQLYRDGEHEPWKGHLRGLGEVLFDPARTSLRLVEERCRVHALVSTRERGGGLEHTLVHVTRSAG